MLFDWRGTGLSGPSQTYNLDGFVADVRCVVDALGLARVDLLGIVRTCHVALEFAAVEPARVGKLVLYSPATSGLFPAGTLGLELIRLDFNAFLVTRAVGLYGFTRAAEEYVDRMKRRWTPESYLEFLSVISELEAFHRAPELECETLVVIRDDEQGAQMSSSRRLAASMRNGRLIVSKSWRSSELRETPEQARVINEFLQVPGDGLIEAKQSTISDNLPEGAVVILFTDIVESTALTERLGDAAFRVRARELDGALRTLVREAGGTPVEGTLLGDGLLAVFTSARQAIDCALRCNAAAEAAGLQLHLGLHAGDVLREGNNVYGGAVNIAARIMGLTTPGQVLVSDTVRSLARTSAGVTFDDQGEQALKGIADPVRVFEVHAQAS